jgi:mannose PTS system EIIA component
MDARTSKAAANARRRSKVDATDATSVGLLIIAHGDLGKTLIRCAAHMLGSAPVRVASIAVAADVDPDALLKKVRGRIAALDNGAGVLILTDMLGGTPSNVATRALIRGRVEGLSGASLPMVIRAITYRNAPLATVVAKAASGGQDGVVHIYSTTSSHATSGN